MRTLAVAFGLFLCAQGVTVNLQGKEFVKDEIHPIGEQEQDHLTDPFYNIMRPYKTFFESKFQGWLGKEDTQDEIHLLQKKLAKKYDPRFNRVLDKPLTQDIMNEFVFPFLGEFLPGGMPGLNSSLKPSGVMGELTADPKISMQLEAAAVKGMAELARLEPHKLHEKLAPKVREYVVESWEGNNNTKEFYARENLNLLELAIKQEGVLYKPFTEQELSTRQTLAGMTILAPAAIWIALLVAWSMYKKQQEQEGAPINPSSAANEKRFFPHLDGMRTVAAMIIIWFHYSGILGPFSMVAAQENAVKPRFSPVSFFLVLSGFCMHYAYCKKVYRDVWDVLKYMVNRLGRVAPSYWVAWALFFYVMHPGFSPILRRSNQWWVDHFNWAAFVSFFMLQSWTEWAFMYTPEAITPTQQLTGQRDSDGGEGVAGDFGNLWTISTLLLPWLIYPLLHIVVTRVTKASPFFGLRALSVLMYVLGLAPALYLYSHYGDELRSKSVYTLKVNPVILLPQFVLGMCTAQLLKQAEDDPHGVNYAPKWVLTLLGDLSISTCFFLTFAVPFKQFDRGFEAMFIGGIAHLLAAWLYFSCLPGVSKGVWTTLCASPIMVKLGEYAMHVYLLQYPLAAIMDAAVHGLPADPRPSFPTTMGLVQLMVGIWAMSIIFAEMVDKPMQAKIGHLFSGRSGKQVEA